MLSPRVELTSIERTSKESNSTEAAVNAHIPLLAVATVALLVISASESAAQGRRRSTPPAAPPTAPPARGTAPTPQPAATPQSNEAPEVTIRRTTAAIDGGAISEDERRQALRQRAVAYAVTGRRGLALADVNVLLKMDSRDADAHYANGLANLVNPRLSVPAFTQAIRSQPERIEFYRARAWTQLAEGSFDDAVGDFGQILQRNPDDADAYRGRAWARLHDGDHGRAIQDFTSVIRLAPANGEAFMARGLAHLFEGRTSEALEDFRSTMRIQPAPRSAGKPFRLDDWRRYQRVMARIDQRIERSPRDVDAWVAYGVAAYRQYDANLATGDMASLMPARTTFDRVLGMKADHVDALMFRAMVHATPYGIYNRNAAIADLTEIIRLHPTHAEAHFRRGLIRAVDGAMLAGAIEDIEVALAAAPGDRAMSAILQKLRADKLSWDQAQQRAAAAAIQRNADMEKLAVMFFAGLATLIITADPAPPQTLAPGERPPWMKEWEEDLRSRPLP
jgi:tetratricopeptide (TPR) repeat protein